MAEIIVLPFPGDFDLGGLFASAGSAEGRLSWFETLARTTLAPGEHAVMVVALDEGRPKAALPLAKSGGSLRALTAPYTTLYAPPLPLPGIARELGLRAREYVSAVLRLDGLDAANPGAAALVDGLKRSGLATACYRGFANWYEPVGDFAAWWQARPSRLKATVRRKLSAAAKRGTAFRSTRDGFGEALAVYEEIHGASWKDAEPHPRFMAEMVGALGADGLVRIGVMTAAGRAVAAQIWLVCGGRGTIFKLAHRQDAADLSPGTLLTHYMAETLIRDDGLEEIDFGRGDDAYKRDWLCRSRHRLGLVAGEWRTAAGLAAVATEVLPTRMGSLMRAFGRQPEQIGRASVTASAEPVLSSERLRRMTPGVDPERGADKLP